MGGKCPNCNASIGTLATSCWKCKSPLVNNKSHINKPDQEIEDGATNIRITIIVFFIVYMVFAVLVVLLILYKELIYLLILFIYSITIIYGTLLKKSWKAEKVMKLNRMETWDFHRSFHNQVILNIFTAQKLYEWRVKKSEMVWDSFVVIFSLILWIFFIVLIRILGPDYHTWSHIDPLIELLILYIVYPISLFVIFLIYYNDFKVYKSKHE
jgi:membrane protease YdiL (CAAX protease family)